MGKVAKAVIGVGLIIAAPYAVAAFAGATATAFTATGFYIAQAAVTLAGSALLGSALKPSLPSVGTEGQGQILSTTRTNNAPVPVVYGQNRLGGNVIFQTTNNYGGGTTNKDFWSIEVLADGEIEGYVNMFANDETLTDNGDGTFTNDYVHINTYTTSGDGLAISDINFAINSSGTLALGSTILGSVSVPTVSSNQSNASKLTDGDINTTWTPSTSSNEWIKFIDNQSSTISKLRFYLSSYTTFDITIQYSDNDSTWTNLTGYTDIEYQSNISAEWKTLDIESSGTHLYWRVYINSIVGSLREMDYTSSVNIAASIPADIAFISVHQLYEATDSAHIQLSSVNAEIQGKKINYFVDASTVSTNKIYSASPPAIVYDIMKETLNITDSDIDIETFFNAQTSIDTNLAVNCHIVYNNQVSTESAIQSALSTARAYISYSNGKWILLNDRPIATVAKSLTSDDILEGTLNISMLPTRDIANKISIKYINKEDKYQVATTSFTDNDLVSLDGGNTIENILDITGLKDKAHADKLAELTLNSMRYSEDSLGNRILQSPLMASFASTSKNAELEVGDVIELDHYLLNYARKFKITNVETDQSTAVKFDAIEYCDTHYKYADDTAIMT